MISVSRSKTEVDEMKGENTNPAPSGKGFLGSSYSFADAFVSIGTGVPDTQKLDDSSGKETELSTIRDSAGLGLLRSLFSRLELISLTE